MGKVKELKSLTDAFTWGDPPPKSDIPEQIKKKMNDLLVGSKILSEKEAMFAFNPRNKVFYVIREMPYEYRKGDEDELENNKDYQEFMKVEAKILKVLKSLEKDYRSRGYSFSLVGAISGSGIERF